MTTTKMTSLARPYAIAAFEYALDEREISSWEHMLNAAKEIANNDQVKELFSNPVITSARLEGLFIDILDPYLNIHKKNFLRLLAENGRLSLLPEIAELFKTFRLEQEKMIDVEVTSAVALDKNYQTQLIQKLKARLHRDVSPAYHVDPELLGGIIVRAGDTVIDGSVRGKLNRLLDSL